MRPPAVPLGEARPGALSRPGNSFVAGLKWWFLPADIDCVGHMTDMARAAGRSPERRRLAVGRLPVEGRRWERTPCEKP